MAHLSRAIPSRLILIATVLAGVNVGAFENVSITGVPDYSWYAGCFGTATGNLMGYWDRHGFPKMYTGPTGNGLAPLNSNGGNAGIRSMWASKAGFDGRPIDQPGHVDDYWEDFDYSFSFESTETDPFVVAGRAEHAPDCLGDFMGQSQNKWADLNGECSGNINGYAFVYWESAGERRQNFQPPPEGSTPVRDIPSGLKAWSNYRGYDADVFSQLANVNPTVPSGGGFTFADLKAEIDAGYPVVLILQDPYELSRSLPGNSRANPTVHAMVAYGYVAMDDGTAFVRYRTSWASGDNVYHAWSTGPWEVNLPLRGVILYHPAPRITSTTMSQKVLTLRWDGPESTVQDNTAGTSRQVHWYIVEHAEKIDGPYSEVSPASSERSASFYQVSGARGFYRVRLLDPAQSSGF